MNDGGKFISNEKVPTPLVDQLHEMRNAIETLSNNITGIIGILDGNVNSAICSELKNAPDSQPKMISEVIDEMLEQLDKCGSRSRYIHQALEFNFGNQICLIRPTKEPVTVEFKARGDGENENRPRIYFNG